VISDETPFPIEPCKIEDVRYKVFRFQVSTDQKVGGSSPSKRTIDEFLLMRTGFLTNRIAFKFCFVSQAKAVQPAR